MIDPGTLLLHDTRTPGAESLLFAEPVEIVEAFTPAQAREGLKRAEAARARGLWVAGYMAYELGFLFEERLEPLLAEAPLLWLGFYASPQRLDAGASDAFLAEKAGGRMGRALDTALSLDFATYEKRFNTIKSYIEAGHVYQVNLTFKARFELEGDATALYRDLVGKQPVAYGALLSTSERMILSCSPELFVENRAGILRTRPMKGTLARGRTLEEDAAGRQALARDPKNRAENLMIVDLLRNDLGRIAEIGSVHVEKLFEVETFRTLHQMTSTITARPRPGLSATEIVANLFPCGSITGAPKLRAMEIIHELEAVPRGVYTGSIGYIAPDGDFCFNVAIRTAVIDKAGHGEIGIGGGIVADSVAEDEFAEAQLKLKFFTDPADPIALIETMLWERSKGFWLLQHHLNRLDRSARYFEIALADGAAAAALEAAASGFEANRMRVRLLLHERDDLSVTATVLPDNPAVETFRFVIAPERMDSSNLFLAHKTTRRSFYDEPRKAAIARHGVDEVVFLNERGELTEGSITTLFIERDGILLTPALDAGLLPGTLRAELLATGRAREARLTLDDLKAADKVFLGNGVRGLMAAEWLVTAL